MSSAKACPRSWQKRMSSESRRWLTGRSPRSPYSTATSRPRTSTGKTNTERGERPSDSST